MLYIGSYCLIPEFGSSLTAELIQTLWLLDLLFECVLMTFFSARVEFSFENFVIFLRTLF
jgi:hypothetical protein